MGVGGDPNGGLLSTLMTGIGNFSVSYNFNSIAIVLLMMSSTVCTSTDASCKMGKQAKWVSGSEDAVVFAGAIFGQLSMGYIGDVIGRGKALGLTLLIAAVSALLSALTSFGSPVSIYVLIILFRFSLGVGLGGVYPLSAAKAAEDAAKNKGSMNDNDKVDVSAAGWAFLWQIPGSMTPWILGLILTSTDVSTNTSWRLILALGTLPASFVVLLSWIEEKRSVSISANRILAPFEPSDSFRGIDSGNSNQLDMNVLKGDEPSTSEALFTALQQPETQRKLLVTGGCWFIYDILIYGVALCSGEIISGLLPATDDVSSVSHVQSVAKLQLIAQSFGFPAVIVTIFILKRLSTRTTQIVSFILIAFAFVGLGLAFTTDLNNLGSFCFYAALYFSLQSGVSVTTFVLPAERYPKSIRTSMNGISAAMGKLGAVFGSYLFTLVGDAKGYGTVMFTCVGISILGAVMTALFLEKLEPKIVKGVSMFFPSDAEDNHGVPQDTDEGAKDNEQQQLTTTGGYFN